MRQGVVLQQCDYYISNKQIGCVSNELNKLIIIQAELLMTLLTYSHCLLQNDVDFHSSLDVAAAKKATAVETSINSQ